jgi:hypothetical protein
MFNSLLKLSLKAVRVERSEAKSKHERPSINHLARFDFAPAALHSARTGNFNKLLNLKAASAADERR